MRRGLYRHARFQGPFRGPNLLVDGGMEAVGVGAWSVTNGVMTKQTSDPYDGVRYGRFVQSGAPLGYIRQVVVSIGQDYRLTGAARSLAGVGRPRIFNGAWIWTGTLSTIWQPIDFLFTALSTTTFFYCRDSGPGDGVDWDALYISLE